jgi:hypothetical protein
MTARLMSAIAGIIALASLASANPIPRRAMITGGGGFGRCVIHINVDATAEVEIAGDRGMLRTVAGQPAVWRRFECNMPLPRNPLDFRVGRVNGRGRVLLSRHPRGAGGLAAVQINDPQRGRGEYAFELLWRGGYPGFHSEMSKENFQ